MCFILELEGVIHFVNIKPTYGLMRNCESYDMVLQVLYASIADLVYCSLE